MHKRLVVIPATLALAASSVFVLAGPAQADTPGCVSKHEYGRVHNGWSKARVNRVFDIRGHQTVSYPPYESRDYRACTVSFGVHGTVSIDYNHGRVEQKSAIW